MRREIHARSPMSDLEKLDCPPGTSSAAAAKVVVNGKIEIACTKPDGARHGPSVTRYENGSKAAEGSYVEDLKEGEWTFWHENGQMSGRGTFHEGKPDGVWTAWRVDGSKESEVSYASGVPVEENGRESQ